ncbi:MAG: hypothetical protein WCK90_03355 [archaeon]
MNWLKRFWEFLNKDSWQSWTVFIILVILFIKLIFFPFIALITGTSLPLVIVESCSMYHADSFENWWNSNGVWYENSNINKSEFQSYGLKNGLNKGDIVLVMGKKEYSKGDIIIFQAGKQYPLIHRIIQENPLATKGDHNSGQLDVEQNIQKEQILGKAVAKIPLVGWVKLIFYEPLKTEAERGLCH